MVRRPAVELIAGVALSLGGCEAIFGADFSNPRLREGGGGSGGGNGAESGSGGSDAGCDSGFPDSTPFCVSNAGFQIGCRDAPACAGHWVDEGPDDRFELVGSDILDNVTGLSWSAQVFVDTSADEHGCRGGYEDPSRIELLSIVDYGRVAPAVDGAVFLGQHGVFHAASSATGKIWQVDFDTGEVRFATPSYPSSRRCKKGSWAPKFDLVAEDEEVVRELASGLLFRRAPIYTTGFFDAAEKCALVAPSSCGPFRVPSIKEMMLAFTDAGSLDPLLDGFPGAGLPHALTSSPRYGAGEPEFWTISLTTGETESMPLATTSPIDWGVYCVSGGRRHE